MSRVAIATCAGVDVDPDSPLLLDALRTLDVDASLRVWDDESVAWDEFDLTVVRSTWDYASRRDQFLEWARGVPRIVNPCQVLEYSSDKHYLADLASRGHRVVATTFCDVGHEPDFPEGDVVVKPAVGAGSMDAERFTPDELDRAARHVAHLHASGRDALIQPYVESVDEVGERALIFIDGAFSHAMTKGAMLNVTALDRNALYRREQMSVASVEPDALSVGARVLREGGLDSLLYARVDLVRDGGAWAVMELELVEPSLFLGFVPGVAGRLAEAIRSRLG